MSLPTSFPYSLDTVLWCESENKCCYSAFPVPYYDDGKGRVSKGEAGKFKTMPNKGITTYQPDKTINPDWTMVMTRCGKETGLFIVDIDVKGGETPIDIVGEELLTRLFNDCSYKVRTGSGGLHAYFKLPEGKSWVKKMNCEEFMGVDVKGQVDMLCDGHGVILAGSYYKYKGETYSYDLPHNDDGSPSTLTMDDIGEMPDWLVEWCEANMTASGGAKVSSGGRSKTTAKTTVVEVEMNEEEVEDEDALRMSLTMPDTTRPRSASPGAIRGLSEELGLVAKFIGCIKADFFKPYDNWFRFITCMKSISTSEACKQLCLKACRKPKKYAAPEHEAATKALWDSIVPDGRMTMGTLRYWARRSQPEEYQKVVRSSYVLMITGNINQVAEVFASEVAGTLVYAGCAGKTDHKFYQYHEHLQLWSEVDESAVAYTLVEVMPTVCDRIKDDILQAKQDETAQKQSKLVWSIGNKIGQGMGARYIPPLRVILNPAVAKSPFLKDKAFKLDERGEILALENGVFNFNTGKLEPYDRSHYCSFKLPISYNPDADTTDIETAFGMWYKGDKDKIGFLKYWLGYCMTGETGRDEFMIVYGSKGGNGKTLLYEEILGEDIFGSHLYQALSEDALVKKGGTNDSLYDAAGKRLLVMSEVGKAKGKSALNVEILKKWTGRGEIAARAVYEREIRFKPQGKVLMLTNTLPELPADDGGIARRLIVLEQNIPFVKPDVYAQYSDELREAGLVQKQDDGFVRRLRANKEGWIKWLLEGAMEYMKDPKREPPASVREYSEQAASACDKYASWIKTNLLHTRMPTDVLRFRAIGDYFCRESGLNPGNTAAKEELRRRIVSQGVDTRGESSKGRLEIVGVRWRVGCDPDMAEDDQDVEVAEFNAWKVKNPKGTMLMFLNETKPQ